MDNSEKLIFVDPNDLENWSGHDRESYELDVDEAVSSIKENGQSTPIIVRPCTNDAAIKRGIKYEVIDGERRMHAGKRILIDNPKFKLKAVCRVLNDDDAYLVQLIANKQSPLSGYSQAKSYLATMNAMNIDRVTLAQKLGIAKSTMTRRLCFLEIPKELWTRIKDKRVVSTALATKISTLLNIARQESKECYTKTVNQLVDISSLIEKGQATPEINRLLKSFNKTPKQINEKNIDGKSLYSIDFNNGLEIKFKKWASKRIDIMEFNRQLKLMVEELTSMQSAEPQESAEAGLTEFV